MTTNDRCAHLVLIRRLAGKEATPGSILHVHTTPGRGANENTNGQIRHYIPKSTGFSELTDETLAEIEWKLIHRPRKSLGYKTPLEYCKQLFSFDF